MKAIVKSEATMAVEETKSQLRKWSSDFIASEKARIECATFLVHIIDNGALSKEEISEETKVPVAIINRIEQIGRRKIHPSLLFRTEYQFQAIARMSIDEQTRIIDRGVELLTVDGSTLKTDVEDLQPSQAKQIFAWDRVRSIGEQKKWIEDQKTTNHIREAKTSRDFGYRVQNNTLVVLQAMSFSRQELKKILQEM